MWTQYQRVLCALFFLLCEHGSEPNSAWSCLQAVVCVFESLETKYNRWKGSCYLFVVKHRALGSVSTGRAMSRGSYIGGLRLSDTSMYVKATVEIRTANHESMAKNTQQHMVSNAPVRIIFPALLLLQGAKGMEKSAPPRHSSNTTLQQ